METEAARAAAELLLCRPSPLGPARSGPPGLGPARWSCCCSSSSCLCLSDLSSSLLRETKPTEVRAVEPKRRVSRAEGADEAKVPNQFDGGDGAVASS